MSEQNHDTNPQPREVTEEDEDRFPGTILTLNPPIPIKIEPPRRNY